ncbi:SpaA isopeptide-forming pilin-related protein [Levilactobacillus tangyuanensis]|uniref:SpaA isopeptide-forming pilin-related protein n=1 Tax=Levilactobacillus tangyuanensis TaxID=2486021 RepID=A0ABW1TPE8_9LACO|nr:SpaA isopeptide-forming pilin-related protein [Levilactobacillus tangyuanensis]
MKKRFMGLVIGLLCLVTVLVTGSVTAQAKDLTEEGNNVTTGLDAPSSIAEETGNNVYTPVTDTSKLYSGQNYQLNYTWGINDNVKVEAGDTATITMPTNASASPAKFDVTAKDANNTVVGEVLIAVGTNVGVITFNDAMSQTNVGRTGTLQFNAVGTDKKASSGGATYVINKNGWVNDNDYTGVLPNKVTWDIVFNPNNKDMGKVTLTDTIGPLQTFINDDSISAKYDDGTVLKPTVAVNGSTVTFTFDNITKNTTLVYYTSVDTTALTGNTSGVFSNKVDLVSAAGDTGSSSTGGDPGTGTGTTDNPITSTKNFHWGGKAVLDGDYVGGFNLTKTGLSETGTTIPLDGAEYTVQKQDADGNWVDDQTGLTTKGGGVLNDPLLPVGDYRLIETKAPDGYLLNKDPIEFTIAASDAAAGNTIHELTQVDNPNSVTLTKKDASTGDVLAGATYQLRDSAGNVVAGADNLVTDANGQVTVSKLAPGDYNFYEVTPPDGYEKNTDPVPVTVLSTDTTAVGVDQLDKPITVDSSSSSVASSTPSSSATSSTTSSVASSSSSSEESSASLSESSSKPVVSSSIPSSSSSEEHSSSIPSTSIPSASSEPVSIESSSAIKAGSSIPQGASSSEPSSSSTSSGDSTGSSKPERVKKPSGSSSSSHPATVKPNANQSSGADLASNALTTANAGGTTLPSAGGAAAKPKGLKRFLPQTNEQKSLFAMILGLLVFGTSLSLWQWRRSTKR